MSKNNEVKNKETKLVKAVKKSVKKPKVTNATKKATNKPKVTNAKEPIKNINDELEVVEVKDILVAGKYPAKEVVRKKVSETLVEDVVEEEEDNGMMTIEELRNAMKVKPVLNNLPRFFYK